MQIIRRDLKESGIDQSWNSIRRIMASQCRVTASFLRADGRALHVRKATRAEPRQLAIYRALNLDPAPEVCARRSCNQTDIGRYFSECSATWIFYPNVLY
ncbi:MAG: hypothetical protein PHO08_10895 [Methylococcales bacterium]|nr:hypothetical protein [Methylococcales bacterium]